MNRNIVRLRNAKAGDVIVVLGRFFHKEMYLNSKGEMCPIIIAVEENDVKAGCITFSHALGYDDKNDKELRHWVCDSLSYGGGDADDFLFVSSPTTKQYAAICTYLVPAASEWRDEPKITRTDKQVKFLDYVRRLKDYFNLNGSLRGFSKAVHAEGVSKLTKEEFYKYGLDGEEKTDDELLAVYEQIKKRDK